MSDTQRDPAVREARAPLCKDCAHYDCSFGDQHAHSQCKLTRLVVGASLVTGEPLKGVGTGMRVYCEDQRAAGWFYARLTNRCGAEGRFFQAKETA